MNIRSIGKKFLSLLLCVMMLTSTLATVVMAEPEDTAEITADAATTDTAEGEATDGAAAEGEAADDTAAEAEGEEGEEGEEAEEDDTFNYLATGNVFSTADEKLNSMVKKTEAFGYALYCDEYTGEVAVKNLTTGQTLFTNPYDLAGSPSSEDVKRQLMSQLEIRYSDSTGTKTSMFSYTEACEKNQIKVKNLKNGLRVEYSLGDEEVRFLVPMQIEKSRYEELIKTHIDSSDLSDRIKNKFSTEGYYVLKDPFDTTLSVREVREMQEDFPVTEEMAIYVFDTEASTREIQEMETYIKSYCPEYTFATLEEDHQLTRYTSTQKAPPLFKMALEYYLDEEGLQIRLPANGIRFDEDEYQLVYVRILPYFGAGSSDYTGYTFIPDGSGALFDFQQLKTEGGTITGKRAIWVQLPGSNIANVRPVNLTINGGELICTNTDADVCVYSYSYGDSFANTNITITGGEFTGLVAFGGGNAKSTEENVTITGGTFNGGVGRYLANDGWEDITV